MDEKKLVPKRRFNGLAGGWRKEKLADIANYRRGSFPQPYGEDKWYDEINGMPFVQVVDVAKNLKLVNDTKQKISKLAQPNSVYVEKGKVLVTLQGSIGRVAITQYPSYVDRTLLIFENYKIQVDTYYFAYIIQLLFDIEKQKAPGGTIKTITKEALSEFIIKIPCYEEQQKIGEFFKVLDNRIANQERKIAKVKALKSAYLTEMFPRKGEVVPRRRFKEFEGEWVESKLGDIVEITMGHSPKSSSYTNDATNCILVQGNADMKKNRVIPRVWTTQITKIANKNDLILTVRAPVGEVGKTDFDVVLGRGVAGIKGNDFIFQYLIKLKMESYWTRLSTGSTFDSVNSEDINEVILSVPKHEEQQKIGQFFKNLDNQIATEEKKLEKLKKMKEAYLEEMFV